MFYPAPSEAQLAGLTFGTIDKEQKEANKSSYNIWDILTSLTVVVIVIYIMLSFSSLVLQECYNASMLQWVRMHECVNASMHEWVSSNATMCVFECYNATMGQNA